MKLGPVPKLDKRNKATLKNLTMTPCQQIVTSFSLFQFKVYVFINKKLTKSFH